jgi:hypothetical protein
VCLGAANYLNDQRFATKLKQVSNIEARLHKFSVTFMGRLSGMPLAASYHELVKIPGCAQL